MVHGPRSGLLPLLFKGEIGSGCPRLSPPISALALWQGKASLTGHISLAVGRVTPLAGEGHLPPFFALPETCMVAVTSMQMMKEKDQAWTLKAQPQPLLPSAGPGIEAGPTI